MHSQRYLIRHYMPKLRESEGTFKSIYEVQFSQKDNVFLEYEAGEKAVSLTYEQVEKKIDSLACYLLTFLRGKTDCYIALNVDNSVEWVVGLYAILKSGNKPYLVNLRHPKELTLGILRTLGVEYSLDLHESNIYGLPSILIDGHMEDEVGDIDFPWANEIALSTSATSMQEKICLYTGKEILAQLRNTEAVLKKTKMVRKTYKGTIKLLAFLPFYHIFGLITTFFWFTYFGYEIVLLKDLAPQTILHTIRRFEVTHVFSVPLFWHEIEKSILATVEGRGLTKKFEKACNLSLKLPSSLSIFFAKRAFKEVRNALFGESVKLCIVGGSYVRPSALRLINAVGYPLFNGYGTSEVGITSCDFSKSLKKRLRCSVGRPFVSAKYTIEDGCLVVSGDSTCYATIVNGIKKETGHRFETLDLVSVDEDGLYYIKGRKSDLIISKNGENINPDDLEASFASIPSLKRFVILGLGEHHDEPTFIGEVEQGLTSEEAEKLKNALYAQNETLPMSSRIETFYLTFDALQSEGAIKVSRAYVRAGLEKKSIALRDFDTLFDKKEEIELGDIESIVAAIFAKNLGLEEGKVGAKSHFVYDLGGTSLSYYAILVEINERFKLQLGYDPEHPCFTVEDFAKVIREQLRK